MVHNMEFNDMTKLQLKELSERNEILISSLG